VQSVRLSKVLLLALVVAAAIGIARPSSMDGALSAWEHLAAKVATRQAALDAVDKELVAEGLLTKAGEVSDHAKSIFNWEREIALPTAGVIVKGCLDECNVCEPVLERELELDLERKRLENELLKKQISLLEKSQEYRCCPDGDESEPEPQP